MNTTSRKNATPLYPKNKNGISISEGHGRISISKPILEYLDYPEYLYFEVYSDDYLMITAGSKNCNGCYKVMAQNKGGHVVNNVKLVRYIYNEYNITRKNPKRMSPFYTSENDFDNDVPAVFIKMKFWNKISN